jgi:hypothetical protein
VLKIACRCGSGSQKIECAVKKAIEGKCRGYFGGYVLTKKRISAIL